MTIKKYKLHKVVYYIVRFALGKLVGLYFGFRSSRYKGPEKPTLIVSNHNSDLDPAFVALGFTRHMYFVSSEHALRAGFPSKMLKSLFNPIAINKAKPDVSSIQEMLRRLKAGVSVCLFAEGDRSFNGLTSPISLSTAKLAKTSGADLITYHLEGAYFVTPRWAIKKRRGRITGRVVNRYTTDELEKKTAEEVLADIGRDLFEDAYKRQAENPRRYPGKNLAENIETVLYLCPGCNKFGTIKSEGNRFYCDCGLEGIYSTTGLLEGDSLPYSTVTDWDLWQTVQLDGIVRRVGYEPICTDEDQQLFEVRPAFDKKLVGEGSMYIDRSVFHCAGINFPLDNIIRFAVVGQKVLLFGLKDGATYEVRSEAPRSALKYREIFKVLAGE